MIINYYYQNEVTFVVKSEEEENEPIEMSEDMWNYIKEGSQNIYLN